MSLHGLAFSFSSGSPLNSLILRTTSSEHLRVETLLETGAPLINHNGKEYMHVPLSHFAVQQKLTQYCKSAILKKIFLIKRIKETGPLSLPSLSLLLLQLCIFLHGTYPNPKSHELIVSCFLVIVFLTTSLQRPWKHPSHSSPNIST